MVRRLIKYTAATKEYVQYVVGMPACVRRASHISMMWRCRLSAILLCSGVCSGVVKWDIPLMEGNYFRAINFPPLSEYNVVILF